MQEPKPNLKGRPQHYTITDEPRPLWQKALMVVVWFLIPIIFWGLLVVVWGPRWWQALVTFLFSDIFWSCYAR